jgi:predicted GNAT family N-acyltransferase
MNTDLLILKEVTNTEAWDIFGGRGAKDRVVYDYGKQTRWFLFGEDAPIGHAAMMKIGPGSNISTHYRFGRWWVAPEYRGTSLGSVYAGALIYYYLKHIIPEGTAAYWSATKKISMHAWNWLVPKYEENGWKPTGVKFKDTSFTQLYKCFYFSYNGELVEQQGAGGKLCEGIIYPGDYLSPVSIIERK